MYLCSSNKLRNFCFFLTVIFNTNNCDCLHLLSWFTSKTEIDVKFCHFFKPNVEAQVLQDHKTCHKENRCFLANELILPSRNLRLYKISQLIYTYNNFYTWRSNRTHLKASLKLLHPNIIWWWSNIVWILNNVFLLILRFQIIICEKKRRVAWKITIKCNIFIL